MLDKLAIARATLAIAVVALLVGASATHAADPEPVRQSEPLRIANRVIIELRGPIAGYAAAERAKAATGRLEAVLAADPEARVSTADAEDGKMTKVLLGGKNGFLVTPIDVDTQAGETTQIVAREAAARLETAVREWREQRTPRYLAIAAAFAAGATLAYAAILWLLFRTNGWVGRRLSAAAAAQAQKLHVGGVRLLDTARVLAFTRRGLGLFGWVLVLAFTSAWLTFVLEQFPYTRPWGEGLHGQLLGMVQHVALAIVAATPGLLLVVVIFAIARGVVRMVSVFFDQVEKRRVVVNWLDADTVRPTRRIFSFVVLVFALAMAYPYLPGASTEAFKGLSVLVGVMVSLGGASVMGQCFNGFILMYTRAYRSGEYVRIGDSEGTIMELGMFTTRLRTGMGEEITLPNSTVMTASIKNFSRAVAGTGYIVDTVVTIGYSTPWRQVEAMLMEAARRTAEIVNEPAPIVRQTALSDFYVEYRLAAYTPVESPARRIDVLNRLHGKIQDVFNEHGVQIMSPHYMMDPAAPQVVAEKDWYAAPARPPGGPVA